MSVVYPFIEQKSNAQKLYCNYVKLYSFVCSFGNISYKLMIFLLYIVNVNLRCLRQRHFMLYDNAEKRRRNINAWRKYKEFEKTKGLLAGNLGRKAVCCEANRF